jgi:hypothetical protein
MVDARPPARYSKIRCTLNIWLTKFARIPTQLCDPYPNYDEKGSPVTGWRAPGYGDCAGFPCQL